LTMRNTLTRSAAPALGLTATRPVLLPDKSDRALRKLIAGLFTVSNRLETTRRHLGARIGLSGPQFSMMMAVAELQGSTGASVGKVAVYMRVAPAFITVEAGKLIEKGYLDKKQDAADGRVSRLRIARKGKSALRSLVPSVRQINDVFFAVESREQFGMLCQAIDRIVASSQRAVAMAAMPESVAEISRRVRSMAAGA
jgi:DNA-binding MarR family transcriptional regulator